MRFHLIFNALNNLAEHFKFTQTNIFWYAKLRRRFQDFAWQKPKRKQKKKTAEAICNRTMFFALEFRVRKKPIYLHKEMIIWRNSTLGIHYTVALSRPLSGPLCPSSRMVSRPKMYALAKFWVDSINFGVHCKHIYKMFRLSEAIIVGNSGHFERLWCDCFSDTWSQIHSVFVVDPLLRFLLFFRIFNI